MAETLAQPEAHGGSPGGLPRRRGGDGAARRTTANPERCGSGGFSSGRRICMPATNPTTVGSDGALLRRPWVKERDGLGS
jgi:hypothetical protein